MEFILLFFSICLPLKSFSINNEIFQNDEFFKKLLPTSEKPIEIEGSGIENIEEPLFSTNSSLTTTEISSNDKCYDQSIKCHQVRSLCTVPAYRSIMIQVCAKTCNVCPQFLRLPYKKRCRDIFENCSSWAQNGFCHSTFYTLDERTIFCRKSCQNC